MGGWSVMWSHCNLTHWDWIGWFWVKYTNFYKSNQITSRLSAGYFLKIHSVQPHLYSKQCGRLCTEKLFKQWLLQCCRVNVSSGDHTCSLTAALVSTESQGYKEVGYRAWNIITAYVLIHWWVNDYESVHLKHNKIVTYYPTGIFDSNFMNEEIKLSVIQLARAPQEGRSQSLVKKTIQWSGEVYRVRYPRDWLTVDVNPSQGSQTWSCWLQQLPRVDFEFTLFTSNRDWYMQVQSHCAGL